MLRRFNLINEKKSDVQDIFMVCPNFEERSIGFLECLEHFESSNLRIFITKLKGANQQELLDEIKDKNTNLIIDNLNKKNIKFEVKKFQYPLSDLKQYISEIITYIKSITKECNLYIDISSMPRNLIFRFLDFLFANIKTNHIQIEELVIKSIYICYTPATAYPSTGNIDQIGGIKGIYKGKAFHQLIRDYEKVDLLMFLAGNTHDSSQTYSQSYEDGVNASINRHLLVFLNQENLIHSYKKIGENIKLLHMAMDTSDKITYFYSIEHIAMILYDEINQIHTQNKNHKSSFLGIGAFGTKTICLCSYLAKKRFDLLNQNHPDFQSDILTNDIGQYVSIYSIGKKISEFYEIDLRKLTDIKIHL